MAGPRQTSAPPELDQVLAQIPDLDQKPTTLAGVKRLDGRLIGQAMSLKLVFGMGIGLIIGAVLPFLFGRGSSQKPVHELPAWASARNLESTNSSGAQTQAPPWQPPAPQTTAVAPPPASPDISVPPPPADGYQPAALTRRTWSPPQNPAPPPSMTPPTRGVPPDYAGGSLPPPPTGNRGYGPANDRYDLQADRRNDPATRYNNPPGYDYRGNPAEGAAPRRDIQPPLPAGDNRYNNTPNYGYQRQPVSPMTPPLGNGAGYDYRNQPQPQPQPQPEGESGVARFEGTITAPPVRTNP
jgi:hypothetical protein